MYIASVSHRSTYRASPLTFLHVFEVQIAQMMFARVTINVPVVYMGRYEVVLRGDYP